MVWSAPAAFWLAASLGVILVLHGIRLFRRRIPTTTLWIWRELAKESHTSLRLERIVRNLPLLLQLALAALLVLALAQPLWFRQVAFDKDVVLIIDVSASMRTRTDGTTRFEKAREAALGLVEDLRAGQRMAIVQMGRAPRLAQSFTDDPRQLETTIRAMAPTDEPAAVKATLLFALSLAKDLEQRQVALIGDGAYHGDDSAAGILNDTVTFIPIEGGGDNAAITQFAYRPYPPPLEGGELLLTVRSYGAAAREITARISLNGGAPVERKLALAAGASQTVLIPVPARMYGVVQAELTPEDALPTDDRAYAVIADEETAHVLLVGPADPPLHAVLQSLPGIAVTYRDALDGELEAGKIGPFDLMIFNTVTPPRVEQGTLAVIGAIAPNGGVRVVGYMENPRVTGWHADDPLLRYVDVQRLQVKRAFRLLPETGTEPLVDSVDGPLITRSERNGLRVVTIGFKLEESRLGAEDAFPLFMSNLVEWAREQAVAGAGRPSASAVAAGESVTWRPVPGAGTLQVSGPGGARWEYAAGAEALRFEQTARVGVYTFRAGGADVPFVVNLLDARESENAPNAAIVGRSASGDSGRGFGEIALEGWPWFVAAGLLFLFLEWLVWTKFS